MFYNNSPMKLLSAVKQEYGNYFLVLFVNDKPKKNRRPH